MVKSSRRTRMANKGDLTSQNRAARSGLSGTASKDAIKAAEQVALAAFGSGLRLAAAIGTVAAKTTSLALASLATGADRFSELVKKEALGSSKPRRVASTRKVRVGRKRAKRF